MKEQAFDYMWDAVNEICRSLEHEPHEWIFETNTFFKRGTDTEYWVPLTLRCITDIWNGRRTSTVFSGEQGARIFKAYEIARSSQADTAQKNIINEVLGKPSPIKQKSCRKWWQFWRRP